MKRFLKWLKWIISMRKTAVDEVDTNMMSYRISRCS
jgi:hypothetical protein